MLFIFIFIVFVIDDELYIWCFVCVVLEEEGCEVYEVDCVECGLIEVGMC